MRRHSPKWVTPYASLASYAEGVVRFSGNERNHERLARAWVRDLANCDRISLPLGLLSVGMVVPGLTGFNVAGNKLVRFSGVDRTASRLANASWSRRRFVKAFNRLVVVEHLVSSGLSSFVAKHAILSAGLAVVGYVGASHCCMMDIWVMSFLVFDSVCMESSSEFLIGEICVSIEVIWIRGVGLGSD